MRDEQKGLLFLILIALIIVGTALAVWLSVRTDKVGESLENNEVLRVLYVLDDGDALMTELVIYYPVSRKSVVVNIPYNVGAIFNSIGRTAGIAAVYRERGIDSYLAEIEKLLAVDIPFYFVFTLGDFIKTVDMLGGLRIFIPTPIDALSKNGERCLLPSGAVTLDGDKVAAYLRYRLPDETDSDLFERYQNVMVAYFTQLAEKKSMLLARNNVRAFNALMTENLDDDDLRALVDLLSDMSVDYIAKLNVTGPLAIVDGEQLVFPLNNGNFIKQAVAQATNMLLTTGDAQVSRIYVLRIQNGTTVQGLAYNTGILYRNAGYEILATSNADNDRYEKTIIIDHIGNREIAELVGDFINCTNIEVAQAGDDETGETAADADFTIILGRDFDGRFVR